MLRFIKNLFSSSDLPPTSLLPMSSDSENIEIDDEQDKDLQINNMEDDPMSHDSGNEMEEDIAQNAEDKYFVDEVDGKNDSAADYSTSDEPDYAADVKSEEEEDKEPFSIYNWHSKINSTDKPPGDQNIDLLLLPSSRNRDSSCQSSGSSTTSDIIVSYAMSSGNGESNAQLNLKNVVAEEKEKRVGFDSKDNIEDGSDSEVELNAKEMEKYKKLLQEKPFWDTVIPTRKRRFINPNLNSLSKRSRREIGGNSLFDGKRLPFETMEHNFADEDDKKSTSRESSTSADLLSSSRKLEVARKTTREDHDSEAFLPYVMELYSSQTCAGPSQQSMSSAPSPIPLKKTPEEEKEDVERKKKAKIFEEKEYQKHLLIAKNSFFPATCAPIRIGRRVVSDSSSDEEDTKPLRHRQKKVKMPICKEFVFEDNTEEEPINQTEFEVERLLLLNQSENTDLFLVKWKGYPLIQSTWEERKNLISCEGVLKLFEERRKICKRIFNSLKEKQKYYGYFDHYSTALVSAPFTEQNILEDMLYCFMINNSLGTIIVENWTRMPDSFPNGFAWISECVFTRAVLKELEKFEKKKKPKICDCEICDPSLCGCLKSCITRRGYVRADKYTNYISECAKSCECSSRCPSKIFRRGRTIPVMIFKTPDCGWSLRTMADIPNRKFVTEYVGLVKRYEECQNISDQTYIFNCDLDDGTTKYVIDATKNGNESRFINHSCDANLDAFSVMGYHADPGLTRIVFFSNRHIKAGEELTFNYYPHTLDLTEVDTSGKRKCRCGASNCRKFLF